MTDPLTLLVTGPTDTDDRGIAHTAVSASRFHVPPSGEIVTSTCRSGVDASARRLASIYDDTELTVIEELTTSDPYGIQALQTSQITEYVDAAVVIWGDDDLHVRTYMNQLVRDRIPMSVFNVGTDS